MLLFDDFGYYKGSRSKEKAFVKRKGKVKVRASVLSSESLKSKDILYHSLELSLVRLLHIDSLSESGKEKSFD
jgi:hypothetical protein